MGTKAKLDFDAARHDLGELIAAGEVALAEADDRIGALQLDVTLGTAPQSELDDAIDERVRLLGKASALQNALAEVEKRAAAAQQADADAARARLQRDLVAAEAKLAKEAASAAAALDRFAAHVAAVNLAERAAVTLSAKVGDHRAYRMRQNLAQALLSRLSDDLAPYLPQQPPNAGKAAESRLRGPVGVM